MYFLDISLDRKYFVLHNSGRCFYIDNIILVRADQSFSYRRLVGDFSFQAVCLGGTNDLELDFLVILQIQYVYFTSDIDLIRIYFVLNNNLCVFQDFFDLFNSCLDITLLIFCCIVLGVLGKVSLLSCLFDFTGNFSTFVYFEIMKLVLQFFQAGIGKNRFFLFHFIHPFYRFCIQSYLILFCKLSGNALYFQYSRLK